GCLFPVRVKDEKIRKNMERILNRVLKAEEERNKIIHAAWVLTNTTAEPTALRLRISARKKTGLQHSAVRMKVKDLNFIAEELKRANDDLLGIVQELFKLGIEKEFKTKV